MSGTGPPQLPPRHIYPKSRGPNQARPTRDRKPEFSEWKRPNEKSEPSEGKNGSSPSRTITYTNWKWLCSLNIVIWLVVLIILFSFSMAGFEYKKTNWSEPTAIGLLALGLIGVCYCMVKKVDRKTVEKVTFQ